MKAPRATYYLGILAAVLAGAAAGVHYARHGTIEWGVIAAGVFCLALGLGARARACDDVPDGGSKSP